MSFRYPKASLSLLLLVVIGLGAGCRSTTPKPAAPGAVQYSHETYENGSLLHRTTVDFVQNEDPARGATLGIWREQIDVKWGASHLRKLPKSFAHMETILLVAGVLVLLGAIPFFYFGHTRLAGLCLLAGGILIAIAVTIEAYAWAYALALLGAAAAVGWYAWSAYRAGREEL